MTRMGKTISERIGFIERLTSTKIKSSRKKVILLEMAEGEIIEKKKGNAVGKKTSMIADQPNR